MSFHVHFTSTGRSTMPDTDALGSTALRRLLVDWMTFAGDSISPQRLLMLATVEAAGPAGIEPSVIAKTMGLDKSTVSRSLAALSGFSFPGDSTLAPLIQAGEVEGDKRRRFVKLTSNGRRLLQQLSGGQSERSSKGEVGMGDHRR
jgi:DNA-binding MarR family transcriptional regulator